MYDVCFVCICTFTFEKFIKTEWLIKSHRTRTRQKAPQVVCQIQIKFIGCWKRSFVTLLTCGAAYPDILCGPCGISLSEYTCNSNDNCILYSTITFLRTICVKEQRVISLDIQSSVTISVQLLITVTFRLKYVKNTQVFSKAEHSTMTWWPPVATTLGLIQYFIQCTRTQFTLH